jgi:hypothetical protein
MHIGAQKRLKAEATYIREVTGMLESIKRNLVRPSSRITATIHSKMISDFNKYKEVMVRLISHDTFMERVVRTIDMVGLGLALMNFLACSEHLMTHEMAKDIFDVLYKMMTPNLDERFTMAKVEIAYKEMLAKHKLLDKHGMTYSKRGYIVPVGTPEVEAVISPSLRGGRAPRRRRQSRRRSGIRRSRRKLRRSTRSAPT